MSTYRSLLRHSATYSIPVIIGKLCSFILLPVYTRYLTPADYGVLELLDLTSFILGSLLGARLGDALCYFYAEATTREARDKVITTALLAALALGAVGTLAGYALTGPLGKIVFSTTAYSPYLHLVFANFVLMLPQEVGLAYLRARNRSGLFTLCQVLRLGIAILFNLLFLAVWSMGISAMLWSTLVASSVLAITVFIIVFTNARLSFDVALCRRMVAYALPVGVGSVAMLIIHYGDRFFLQRSASLADVGIYSLAYKLGMLVGFVQLPFATYWTSQMYRIVRDADGKEINARVCTYLMLALSAAAVVITACSRPALFLLTTPEYRAAAQFIPLIAASYVIRGLGDQFRCVFFVENRTGIDAQTSTLGSALCLLGYATLIPVFKMWGAVTATLIAFIGVAIYSYWKAQQIQRYRYEVKRLWKIGLSACLAGAVVIAGENATIEIQLVMSLAGLLLFPALLFASQFFRPEEIDYLMELRGYLRPKTAKAMGARAE